MKGPYNSNRLLYSTAKTEQPILKVFDMNLKDIRYHHDCFVCDNNKLHKPSENRSALIVKNHSFQAKNSQRRESYDLNTAKKKYWNSIRKAGKIRRSNFLHEAEERIKKSMSVAGFSKVKETLPVERFLLMSNRNNEFAAKSTRRTKRSCGIMKTQNSFANFDKILYKTQEQSNQTKRIYEKLNQNAKSSQKTQLNYSRADEKDHKGKPKAQICKTEYTLSAAQEQADLNLLKFLNMKLFGLNH